MRRNQEHGPFQAHCIRPWLIVSLHFLDRWKLHSAKFEKPTKQCKLLKKTCKAHIGSARINSQDDLNTYFPAYPIYSHICSHTFYTSTSRSACQGCQITPKSATEMVLATMPNRIRGRSPMDFCSLGTTKSSENEAERPTSISSHAKKTAVK